MEEKEKKKDRGPIFYSPHLLINIVQLIFMNMIINNRINSTSKKSTYS